MTTELKRYRNWVFTINTVTKKEQKQVFSLLATLDRHIYAIVAPEIAPTTGRKHLQGYIQLSAQMTRLGLQKYLNITRKGTLLKFHCDNARGSLQDNKKYISKGGEFYEFGTPKKQGSRSDLDYIRSALSADPSSLFDLIRSDVSNYQQLRFAESFFQYQKNVSASPPLIFWVTGDPVITATFLLSLYPPSMISRVSDPRWLGQDYKGEEILFIDFPDPSSLPYSVIQKFASPFTFSLPRKGSSVPLIAKIVILASPDSFSSVYSSLFYQNSPPFVDLSLSDFKKYSKLKMAEILPFKNLKSK